jgi:hypothetical protein
VFRAFAVPTENFLKLKAQALPVRFGFARLMFLACSSTCVAAAEAVVVAELVTLAAVAAVAEPALQLKHSKWFLAVVT